MKMPSSEIVAVYLAAGQSSRMGASKLSLPVGVIPLGSWALQAALTSQLDRVLVVTKREDTLDWFTPSLFDIPTRQKWSHIPCAESVRGQAHSLRCGLQAAQECQAKAVMILLADQPFVTTELIDELIYQYKKSKQEQNPLSYVAAGFQGMPRPPILYSHQAIPMLMHLQGDEGARRLLRQGSSLQGTLIECADSRMFFDVDTRVDYELVNETHVKNEKTP